MLVFKAFLKKWRNPICLMKLIFLSNANEKYLAKHLWIMAKLYGNNYSVVLSTMPRKKYRSAILYELG